MRVGGDTQVSSSSCCCCPFSSQVVVGLGKQRPPETFLVFSTSKNFIQRSEKTDTASFARTWVGLTVHGHITNGIVRL